ncbi:MAG TPA: redoxin domain-containing protein [Phycisphaerae bacterium]|nr:redoxin domain-containing protein [Phycisphaerae bacterium]
MNTRTWTQSWSLMVSACALHLAVAEARAEFTISATVPDFKLRSTGSVDFSFTKESGAIELTRGGQQYRPKLLAIHLLQPDCLQCRAQLKALEQIHRRFAEKGLALLGISHRDDEKALAALGTELNLTFPLLMGTGSHLASKFAAGDTFGLIDGKGVVRFAQVGYGAGDEKVWIENIEAMLAGKPPVNETIEREPLRVGDSFPAIVLLSLAKGKPMELVGADGKLVFRGEDGKELRPKSVLFFFSRY